MASSSLRMVVCSLKQGIIIETKGMVLVAATTKHLRFPPGEMGIQLGWCQREVNEEATARPRFTANANFTTMRLHNLFDDRQPQPGSMLPTTGAGRVSLVEPVENVGQGFRRN